MAGREMRATAVVCVAMVLVVGVASCSGASTGSATLASADTSAIGTAVAQPEALAFDHAGNLYISEFAGHFVDRVDPEGGSHASPGPAWRATRGMAARPWTPS